MWDDSSARRRRLSALRRQRGRSRRSRDAGDMLLMFVSVFLPCCLCGAQLNQILQPAQNQTLTPGDMATIRCFIESKMSKRVWYKLTAGRKLQLVATLDAHYNRSVFADGSHQRYSANFDWTNNHLIISPVTASDVGTYFCGVLNLDDIQFGSGTSLTLKGASGSFVVQHRDPEHPVRPGDTVTLGCSVFLGQCSAEHVNVKWLKKSAAASPKTIPPSANQRAPCQPRGGEEITCEYILLMKNLSWEDAGTYYCLVTSCGQTLYGSGTELLLEDYLESRFTVSWKSYSLLIFLLSVSLSVFVCLIGTAIHCLCTGSSASHTVTAQVHSEVKRSKGQRDDTWSECVYLCANQQD